MTEATRALRSLPELAGLRGAQLRRLAHHFDEVRVGAGTTVLEAGRPAGQYVVVLEGALEACGGEGCARIAPGGSAGWEPMWNRAAAPATVRAVNAARLLVMGRAEFRAARALASELGPGGRA